MEKFSDQLDDTLCVGQRRPNDKDESVLLFLKMRPDAKLTPELVSNIKSAIKAALSARHVPAHIFEVEDIPVSASVHIDFHINRRCLQYTVNGKKIEIAVKQIVSGSNLTPSGTVANPDSLKLYYKFRDIENLVASTKAKL